MDRCGKCPLKSAMLVGGLLSGFIMGVLLYYTGKYLAAHENYCILWIDIPGRLVLFFLFYYMSGVLGCLPIPESCHPRLLPEPFLLWKFWTWRDQCREMRTTYEDLDTAPTNDVSRLYYPPYRRIDVVRNVIPTAHTSRQDYQRNGNLNEESRILNNQPVPAAQNITNQSSFQPRSCTSYGSAAENFPFPNFHEGPRADRLDERIQNENTNDNPEASGSIRHDHPRCAWAIFRRQIMYGDMPIITKRNDK